MTSTIRALRELTRTRVALIQRRTQAKNRDQAVLEDTNLKLASVVSEVFGKSGRRMLAALIGGERAPRSWPPWHWARCGASSPNWSWP
jgi:hypothetical protein